MISKEEYKILEYLMKKGKSSIDDISKEINFDSYKVLRLCGFLKEKGLINLTEIREKKYSLDNLGIKYLNEGLPETKMFNIVKNRGKIRLEELKNLFSEDEFNYALGFLRKNNYIEIKDGYVYAIKNFRGYEENLRRIYEGKYDENDIKLFLNRRGILKQIEKVYYIAEINENGLKALEEYSEDFIDILDTDVIVSKKYKERRFREFDINIGVNKRKIGKYNKYLEFLDKIRYELISMGFKEMEDYDMIISHFWDLDALFMPQDHPASDISFMDAYYLKNVEIIEDFPLDLYERVKENHKEYFKIWNDNIAKRAMLISQNTAISARTLYYIKKNNLDKKPGKYFLIEKVFRYDTIDAKHFIEFNQLEGIIVGEDLTFKHLLGILEELIKNVTKTNEVKFYPAFFPFTEPSVEVYVKHKDLNWIEVAGAGVFREELLKPFGIESTVIAWGIGIDRLAMISLGIKDIRELHTRNIKSYQD